MHQNCVQKSKVCDRNQEQEEAVKDSDCNCCTRASSGGVFRRLEKIVHCILRQ